ncbi:hypothetical protein D3C77_467030 [compost metagenome]
MKKFAAKPLPHFLEGPARWLKTIDDIDQAQEVYELIRKSDLYDEQVQMYKTSVSLDNESQEIGRIRAFTPGWLERESVFLHMSYKYLLALLKSGLKEQFFAEIKTSLIPFLDPAVYGRSTLENSSFIATSVNPDPHVHGRGFVARLSGSTAEFMSMWIKMMMGSNVFTVEDGKLQLSFKPTLPEWLFDEQGEISFKFLGSTQVTYHNPRKADTFGTNKAVVERIHLVKKDGSETEIDGAVIGHELAHEVRGGLVNYIHIYLK